MHVADFHRDSGTVLVRTSKAGKIHHIELTGEGLEFFDEITAGRAGPELLFHRDGAPWGKSQQRPLVPHCQDQPSRVVPYSAAHLCIVDGHG